MGSGGDGIEDAEGDAVEGNGKGLDGAADAFGDEHGRRRGRVGQQEGEFFAAGAGCTTPAPAMGLWFIIGRLKPQKGEGLGRVIT